MKEEGLENSTLIRNHQLIYPRTYYFVQRKGCNEEEIIDKSNKNRLYSVKVLQA